MDTKWNTNAYLHAEVNDKTIQAVVDEWNSIAPPQAQKMTVERYREQNKSKHGGNFIRMQGWVFMSDFGKHMVWGTTGVKTNVYLEDVQSFNP